MSRRVALRRFKTTPFDVVETRNVVESDVWGRLVDNEGEENEEDSEEEPEDERRWWLKLQKNIFLDFVFWREIRSNCYDRRLTISVTRFGENFKDFAEFKGSIEYLGKMLRLIW